MGDERAGYGQTRARLEDIVAQVRRKDVSLEKCLDLLEEGVRLANECNELTDQTEWRAAIEERDAEQAEEAGETALDHAGAALEAAEPAHPEGDADVAAADDLLADEPAGPGPDGDDWGDDAADGAWADEV